jgi:hypothetical protein
MEVTDVSRTSSSHRILAALGLAALTACSGGAGSGSFRPGPAPTAAAINAEDLRHRIEFLAHDTLGGRDTGSPGLRAAALYLAGEMQRLGLRPAGDQGTYLQRVPLERRLTHAEVVVTASARRPMSSDEIVPVSGVGGLPEAARLTGSGPLVFAGHMADPDVTAATELRVDDLQGAAVIVRLGAPAGVDPQTTPPRLPIATLFSPASRAAAVLLVAEGADAEFWEYASEVARQGSVTLANGASATQPTAPPFFLITAQAAERLLGGSLEEARQPRTGLGTFEFHIDPQVVTIEGWNVAAVLPGSDPARAGEFIGLGAHYDHVGVGTPIAGDSIYNGADDNASGTAALLEIAEAFANLPAARRPARSVLFVWKTAEEQGLLGSEYFTDRPTVDRDGIIAHINLDMVGRNHPDSIFSVGSRRISTQLGEVVEAVNARQSRPFAIDYSYDAPGHPERVYCRSDHYSYARYGIPIVFLTTGLHDDYHAPSDRAELLDYEKVARVSALVRDLTLELANRPDRPRVDQPVPALGTPCV